MALGERSCMAVFLRYRDKDDDKEYNGGDDRGMDRGDKGGLDRRDDRGIDKSSGLDPAQG